MNYKPLTYIIHYTRGKKGYDFRSYSVFAIQRLRCYSNTICDELSSALTRMETDLRSCVIAAKQFCDEA